MKSLQGISSFKLCFFSILFTLPIAMNGQGNILETIISREYEEEDLYSILVDLEKKYNLPLKYNAENFPETKRSLSFNDVSLAIVLKVLLEGTGFDYISDGISLIVLPSQLVKNKISIDPASNSVDPTSKREENTVSLLGQLRDSVSFEPIESALILLKENGNFGISDANGQFSFELLPGSYTLIVSSLTQEQLFFDLQIERDTAIRVFMKQRTYLIDEVVIASRAKEFNVKKASAGLNQLSNREIKKVSAIMGERDVVRSILTLAGVNNIGEGTTGFNVRGGSIDQNLILQDGALIYNPSHVLGFFSAFNPDIVQEVLLYKGHIPANYGGRSSSVLEVKIKEPDFDEIHGGINVGLVSSKASISFPIIKGKTSLLVSGRKSYGEWLLNDLRNLDLRNSAANFYDTHVKMSHKFDDKTRMSASFFQSFDKFRYSDKFGYSWRNQAFDIHFRKLINDQLSASFQISKSSIFNEQFDPSGANAFSLTSGMKNIKFSADVLWNKNQHTIRIGMEFLENKSRPEQLLLPEISPLEEKKIEKNTGNEWSVYINDEFDLFSNLGLDVGLRTTLYQQVGPGTNYIYNDPEIRSTSTLIDSTVYENRDIIYHHVNVEPRISLRYSLSETSSFKLSYNRITQYIHLISNTAAPTPIDIWQVSTGHLLPLKADNFSIGYYANTVDDQLEFSGESYFRLQKNTLDYKDFASLLLNSRIEGEVLRGKGKSYGLELAVSKPKGTYTGRFSYSFSRALRKVKGSFPETTIANGDWFPSSYDQPHTIKWFMDIETSRKSNFSVNFIFSTGRPITAPVANYLVRGVIVPHFSQRNQYRIPNYHRLDISFRLRMSRRSNMRYLTYFTMSIYNLYARKNAFSIYYHQGLDSIVNAKKLSVSGTAFPAINLSIQF